MNKLTLVALAATALPCLAHAAEGSVSTTVGVSSDYVFRGVSQTLEDPFSFVAVHLSKGAFYAGFGMENVDFGNEINAEYDYWMGWSVAFGGTSLDLRAIRYGYLNTPAGVDIDTVEYKLGVSHDFGSFKAGADVYYTSDYFGTDDDGQYLEANGSMAISETISASLAYGMQGIGAGGDYNTWNIGATWNTTYGPSLDLRYHDTDAHERGDVFNSRIVGTVTLSY